MEIEWKKIASMEYGKIIYYSIPYHALVRVIINNNNVDDQAPGSHQFKFLSINLNVYCIIREKFKLCVLKFAISGLHLIIL